MNYNLIKNITELNANYEKKLALFKDKDNIYNFFIFNYNEYYVKFLTFCLKDLKKELFVSKNIEPYTDLILPLFKTPILKKITEPYYDNNALLQLYSQVTKDVNTLLVSYQKLPNHLKSNYIQQYIKSKEDLYNILSSKNLKLLIETISKIKSPKIQYFLINHNLNIRNSLLKYFESLSDIEKLEIIALYFHYPATISPQDYLNQWIGDSFVHLKFVQKILGDFYDTAKIFISHKNKINQSISSHY